MNRHGKIASGIVLILLTMCFGTVQAQWNFDPTAKESINFGFYEADEHQYCLPDFKRQEIQAEIQANIIKFQQKGLLQGNKNAEVKLTFPLAASEEYTMPGFHGLSNYVDHNPNFPDQLQDYFCGQRTYDTATGYNHRGVDYFNWPFSWYMMDHDHVEVVAAAPGMIISRVDGHPDRNCNFNNPNWNAVYVIHEDNSVAWYGHMKRNSITDKQVGDFVERGEYLGVVGSSGASTGPHLHFELYNGDQQIQDPFSGTCNSMNSFSWWENQPSYTDSALNAIRTHSAPPQFFACPQSEIPHYNDEFVPGDLLIMAAFYRDQLSASTSNYKLIDPNGTVMYDWNHNSPNNYVASYWYWQLDIPENAQEGIYQFRVTYRGSSITHEFQIGDVFSSVNPDVELPDVFELSRPYPNPFNPTAQFTLSVEQPQFVTIDVINMSGQRVATISESGLNSGVEYSFTFNGDGLSSGVYIIRARGEHFNAIRKVTLLK